MKPFWVALFCATMPLTALAEDALNCQQAWADFSEVSGLTGDGATTGDAEWCEVATATMPALEITLRQFAFRLGMHQDALPDSRSVDVRFEHLQTPFGIFEGALSLSHQTQSGMLHLHQFTLLGEDGRGMRAQAYVSLPVGQGNVVAPPNIGDMAVRSLNVDIIVTPDLLDALQIDATDVTRGAVDSALRDVPDAQVSGKSRRAFMRFVDAIPTARGTLSIEIDAANGRTLMESAGPFLALEHAPSEEEITRAFALALEGVSVDLAWKPGRM